MLNRQRQIDGLFEIKMNRLQQQQLAAKLRGRSILRTREVSDAENNLNKYHT